MTLAKRRIAPATPVSVAPRLRERDDAAKSRFSAAIAGAIAPVMA